MDPIEKQLKQIEKKELRRCQKAAQKSADKKTGITGKLQEKIPPKLVQTLEAAFEKGFRLVLEKGSLLIEKTYDREALTCTHEMNDRLIRRRVSRKRLRALDKQAGKAKALDTVLTAAEGMVLGLLGIGLPDIPVFLGVLLRGVYQAALCYGFPCDSTDEKIFVLNLVADALEGTSEAEKIARLIADGLPLPREIDAEISRAAKVLSQRLLTTKFIQGLPIIGAVGGPANAVFYRKVASYAALQYKKRYLRSLSETS